MIKTMKLRNILFLIILFTGSVTRPNVTAKQAFDLIGELPGAIKILITLLKSLPTTIGSSQSIVQKAITDITPQVKNIIDVDIVNIKKALTNANSNDIDVFINSTSDFLEGISKMTDDMIGILATTIVAFSGLDISFGEVINNLSKFFQSISMLSAQKAAKDISTAASLTAPNGDINKALEDIKTALLEMQGQFKNTGGG